MPANPSVTMSDVAREAGVHPSTVSLALRGSPRLSEATRQRVVAVADRLGYHPNPLVTALMKNRRSPRAGEVALTAGYLSFDALSPVLREEPIYAEFERGAFDEARRQGLRLEKFLVSDEMSIERIDQVLTARGSNGLIVSPLPADQHTLTLNWDRYAAVAIGPTLRSPILHQVMSNHYENMSRLLDACIKWGYKRPGLCLDVHSDERIGGQWEACYLRQQVNHPLMESVELFSYTELDSQALNHWLSQAKPDIILCLSVREVLDALRDSGLCVPDDIAVASVTAARPDGWVSGIVEDGYSAGSQAVSQLLRMIYSNERGIPEKPLKVLIPSHVHRGQSTRR